MKTKTTSIEAGSEIDVDKVTAVVGIDLGDKHSAYCVLDSTGALIGTVS